MTYFHQPVLLDEVLFYLNPLPGQNFIDATIGGGGHAAAILQRTAPAGRLLGLDRDPAAIAAAQKNLAEYSQRFTLIQDSYKNIDKIIYGQGLSIRFNGILLDLGFSAHQISAADQRGFSFQKEAGLDMRFGPDSDVTAQDIVNNYPENKLAEIFYEFGEEPQARQIAKQIILFRKQKPLTTTFDLLEAIQRVKRTRPGAIHPATKVFQALRIAVNQELEVLAAVLPKLISLLPGHGRLAVISFHSLEDRIVKKYFSQENKDCLCPKEFPICRCGHNRSIKIITKKAVKPTPAEIHNNPRSRSAKLRVIEKI